MSEIEKLYENAGFETEIVPCYSLNCEYFEVNKGYPLFTAEKQLDIIKLLTQQCDLTISHFEKWEFIHFDGQESIQITGKDFTETFAKLINAYWKNLTDKEKRKIKEILK